MTRPDSLNPAINHSSVRPIVVLGMHRSGTSVLSRAMTTFGYMHCANDMPPDQFNRRGYWEDADIVSINEAILSFLERRWHDLGLISSAQIDSLLGSHYAEIAERVLRSKIEAGQPLVFKDPRLTILLRFWISIFDRCSVQPHYLFSVRHPEAVIASLQNRNGFAREKPLWLWMESTISVLDCLVDQPVLVVSYERMLTEPSAQLGRLSRFLGLPCLPSAVNRFCTEFLDQDLCNAQPHSGDDHGLPSMARELLNLLRHAAADERPLVMQRDQLVDWLNILDTVGVLVRFARQKDRKADEMIQVANDRLALLEAADIDLHALTELNSLAGMSMPAPSHSLGNPTSPESCNRLEEDPRQETHERPESSDVMPTAALRGSITVEAEAVVSEGSPNPVVSANQLTATESTGRERSATRWPSEPHRSERDIATAPKADQGGMPGLSAGPRRLLAGILAAFRFEPFDASWYHAQSPSLPRMIGVARVHFALFGAWQGRAPHAGFDAERYLLNNPDVGKAGYSAEYHYMLAGWREGRSWDATLGRQQAIESYGEWSLSNKSAGVTSPLIRNGPLISVLMPVYQVCSDYLVEAVKSVILQTYANWELCIAMADGDNEYNRDLLLGFMSEEPRIRVEILANAGIAANTNHALRMARGQFIALLDHDDVLSNGALADFAAAMINNPSVDILYSDKDNLDVNLNRRCHPLLKPRWSPEMMFSVNYLTHLTAVRRSLADAIGGFRMETDGAQDWDFFLRAASVARAIERVPGIHYHWRIHPNSTASGIAAKPYALAAQKRSLEDELQRQGLEVKLEPSLRSGFHLLWKSTPTMHVFIHAVGVTLKQILRLLTTIGNRARVTIFCDDHLSASHHAKGQFKVVKVTASELTVAISTEVESALRCPAGHAAAFLFLDARVQDISLSGVSELAAWVVQHPGIGFASALIVNNREQIVEAGLVVDAFGQASPLFRGCLIDDHALFGSPLWYRNCTASHPWCVAVHAELLHKFAIGRQLAWPSAFVQLCRDLHANGHRGLVNPHVRVSLHHRDMPVVPAFHHSLADDPYFHPAFSSVVPLRLHQPSSLLVSTEQVQIVDTFLRDAKILARQLQVSRDDWQSQQQFPERVGVGPGAGWCHWYLPNVSHIAYGGVMTIFRLAAALTTMNGSRHRFFLIGAEDPGLVRNAALNVFPALAESLFTTLTDADCSEETPSADYAFATLWTTTYTLLRVRNAGLKFYLIQDYEPLFYPAGSLSAQAALSYKMGFHHIYNTASLQSYCQSMHETRASISFDPQIDPHVIYGEPYHSHRNPVRIFFYCRPDHPRNGFALVAEVIRLTKKRLGNLVELVCAGDDFDARDHDLEGCIINYGRLSYHSSAALYRTCDIGLVLMLTRHPSYLPLELMASGALVITNRNPANGWLLQHGHNCLLTETSPPLMVATIEAAIADYEKLHHVRLCAQATATRYSDWHQAFLPVITWIQQLSRERQQA